MKAVFILTVFILTVFLFYIFSPGILFTFPSSISKITITVIHAFIFAVVYDVFRVSVCG